MPTPYSESGPGMPASFEWLMTISAAWRALITGPPWLDMVAAMAPETSGALAEVPLTRAILFPGQAASIA